MTTEIKVGKIFPSAYELADLYKDNFEEVYGSNLPYPLDVNWGQFEKMDELGLGLGLYAYYEGVIVGYSINILTPSLHSKNVVSCTNDVLYVDPIFRDTSLGLRLIKETEEAAKERGADVMFWFAPIDSPLDKILQRKKYKRWDTIYSKDLGGADGS